MTSSPDPGQYIGFALLIVTVLVGWWQWRAARKKGPGR